MAQGARRRVNNWELEITGGLMILTAESWTPALQITIRQDVCEFGERRWARLRPERGWLQ